MRRGLQPQSLYSFWLFIMTEDIKILWIDSSFTQRKASSRHFLHKSSECSFEVNLLTLCPLSLLSISTQPPPAYSHPSTASYSVQQAPAVAHAVTASYSPAPVQAARPVVSAAYPAYQSHQAPPEYAYRQPDPPAPPQPTTTPQTYQVYSDTVSLFLLPL